MPLLHVVSLRFRDDLSDADIIAHMRRDVNLQARMPHLVMSWTFRKNETLRERAEANGGCGWVVMSKLFRAEDLQAYIDHEQHRQVAAIQRDLITNKFVVDFVVGEEEFTMSALPAM